ncbi:MAG: tripartite tricarboxylate transporter TctB family protein [Candidatus Choladocola sp.]|nr:tripartite tricarboxylate transporter TctB family protein [Candidatus Choladocola sp.]
MKKLNVTFGAILVAAAAYFFYYAGTFKAMTGQQDIGPSAFPRAVCLALAACGIILIIREMKKNSQETVSLFNVKLAVGVVAVIVYFLLLPYLGFVIDSIWIVGVMVLILLNEPLKKAWPLALGVTIGAPIVLYTVFGVFLKVPLPNGILAGILG